MMQLTNSTQNTYNVDDPWNYKESVRGSAEYLKDIRKDYRTVFTPPLSEEDVLKYTLAEYNLGPTGMYNAGLKSVETGPNRFKNYPYSKIEPNLPSETRTYVKDVLKARKIYKQKWNEYSKS